MATHVKIVCDICGDDAITKEPKPITCVRVTDKTEGRRCTPYIDSAPLDLCRRCASIIIKERTIPTVSGAQGFNTFKLTSPLDVLRATLDALNHWKPEIKDPDGKDCSEAVINLIKQDIKKVLT